jgi:uncharacterized protein (DUF2267 family)
MSTGLAVFDTSIQDANLLLKDVEAELADCSRQEAYAALRAVLHAVRDRLPAHEAVNFAAQLPMLVRGLYYEAWTLPEKPKRTASLAEFGDAVRDLLPPRYRFDPIMAAKAVFAAITEAVSEGEAEKVASQLPAPIGDLWARA